MAVGDIKLKWTKDEDGWWGTLIPMFLIYKSGKKMYLDYIEPARKPECQHRHIEIKSIHQGKCMAAEIIKLLLKS